MVLKCPLQGLDGTTVELRSRLWNSTFIEVTYWISVVSKFVTCVFCVMQCDCLTFAALFYTQDYASLSHLHILVKASLVLHGHAKNMMLRTPDTNVSRTALCINPLTAVYYLIHSLCLGVLS